MKVIIFVLGLLVFGVAVISFLFTKLLTNNPQEDKSIVEKYNSNGLMFDELEESTEEQPTTKHITEEESFKKEAAYFGKAINKRLRLKKETSKASYKNQVSN